MSEKESLVINTGPLIALTAATGNVEILRINYGQVIVPCEVCQEITRDNLSRFAAAQFAQTPWLDKRSSAKIISPYLAHALDLGEAAVIQTALDERIGTVCIDEAWGRQVARLAGLRVIGSIGVILRAQSQGVSIDTRIALRNMKEHGVWISARLEKMIMEAMEE